MDRLTRRDFVRTIGKLGAGAFLSSPLLAACGGDPSTTAPGVSQLEPLTIGYLPITDATPLLVAHDDGLFARYGIDSVPPSRYRSWPEVTESVHRSLVEVSHLLMPLAIRARFASGEPIKVVAWNHTGGSALTVAQRIERIEDLTGGTIAIPHHYSIHNVLLQMMLRNAGLEVSTIGAGTNSTKLIVMPPVDMPSALSSGTIDGYIVAEPYNAISELSGDGKILRFSGDAWRDHACCVLVVHEHEIEERPDWVQGLVNGVVAGQLTAIREPSRVAELLSTDGKGYLGEPKEVIERALNRYGTPDYRSIIRNPDWGVGRIGFAPFPFPTYTERLVAEMRNTVVDGDTSFLSIPGTEIHAELVDDRFVRKALEEVGGPSVFGLPASLDRKEEIRL